MVFCSFLNCKASLGGAYCVINDNRAQCYTGNSVIVDFNL